MADPLDYSVLETESERFVGKSSSVDTTLIDFVSPCWVPEVHGVAVAAHTELDPSFSSKKTDFFTWSEVDCGLMVAAGSVSASGSAANIFMPLVSASLSVAAKSVLDPDPMQILDAVNTYLLDHMASIQVCAKMTVAIWDYELESLWVASAGDAFGIHTEGEKIRILSAQNPPLGVSGNLEGVPELIPFALGDFFCFGSSGLRRQLGETRGDALASLRSLILEKQKFSAESVVFSVEGAADVGASRKNIDSGYSVVCLERILTLS